MQSENDRLLRGIYRRLGEICAMLKARSDDEPPAEPQGVERCAAWKTEPPPALTPIPARITPVKPCRAAPMAKHPVQGMLPFRARPTASARRLICLYTALRRRGSTFAVGGTTWSAACVECGIAPTGTMYLTNLERVGALRRKRRGVYECAMLPAAAEFALTVARYSHGNVMVD